MPSQINRSGGLTQVKLNSVLLNFRVEGTMVDKSNELELAQVIAATAVMLSSVIRLLEERGLVSSAAPILTDFDPEIGLDRLRDFIRERQGVRFGPFRLDPEQCPPRGLCARKE